MLAGTKRTLQEFEESLGVSFNALCMDASREWNKYINVDTSRDEAAVKYRFVNGGGSGASGVKNIEELFAESVSSDSVKKEVGMSDMLKALAGLDRVKEFLEGK